MPWDFDDPNPIPFLSARGAYLIAVRGPDVAWAAVALKLLADALADRGVGAKTSSGYGRLVPTRPLTPLPTSAAVVTTAPPISVESTRTEPPRSVPERGVDPDRSEPPPRPDATRPTPAVPPDSRTLAERIAALEVGSSLNERLAELCEREWSALEPGPARDAAAWALVAKLREAKLWDVPRTQRRNWVQAIIRYLNSRRAADDGR